MATIGSYAFIDVEVGLKDHKVHDIGAMRSDGAVFHDSSKEALMKFVDGVEYLCGHNIVHHDVKYLFGDSHVGKTLVDTLYMSPLLFAERPYHRLVKDYKLTDGQLNNPLNDCKMAHDLLMDEMVRWGELSAGRRAIFASLLSGVPEFEGFMKMIGATPLGSGLPELIADMYMGRVCANADVGKLVQHFPCELAYALALIDTTDSCSITPAWVLHTYPSVDYVLDVLRNRPCETGCVYCTSQLDMHSNLRRFFGFGGFRTYQGEPLQERQH